MDVDEACLNPRAHPVQASKALQVAFCKNYIGSHKALLIGSFARERLASARYRHEYTCTTTFGPKLGPVRLKIL
jgi:hypothetical protein